MTLCHIRVKHGKNRLETGVQGIFGSKKPNMTSIYKIDNILISYAKMMTHCYSRALINAAITHYHPLSPTTPTITHF